VRHPLSYLGEKQPWRTVTLVIGGVATLVMVGRTFSCDLARAGGS